MSFGETTAGSGWAGRVALVVGGGAGLGRALALALAAQGASVLVVGRRERPLGETVGEIAFGGGRARHRAGDVRDARFAEGLAPAARELFGRLDLAVAAACGATP